MFAMLKIIDMDSVNKNDSRKRVLVEKYGAIMERHENMTPIASRIFATLFIGVDGSGETFENLVNFLGASKSTISTNLSNLKKSGYITYYTKPGDRKKYFVLAPESFLARMEEERGTLVKERNIVKEIVDYKIECVEGQPENKIGNFPYLDFLNDSIGLLDTLTERINLKIKNRQF